MNQTAAAAAQPKDGGIAGAMPGQPPESAGRIAISCYENDVPAFVEEELQRLYGSLYSSMAQFRIYYGGGDVSTYIVREGSEIRTVFLFSRHDGRVRVANEVFEAREEDIRRFVAHVFSTMPDVRIVSFKSVWTNLRRLPYPFHRANHIEDYVVSLPATPEEYLGRLNGATRRKLKRKMERFERDFPSFRFETMEGPEIGADALRKIIALNHVRMAGKSRLSMIDGGETERMIRLARECGLAAAVTIDGKVCAGAISFRSGPNYFLNVIAHDPAYDEYGLGTLCCFWTVSRCIEKGAREFHFLWGRYDYKQMLLGVERPLDNVDVYRSRIAMIRHAGHALGFAVRAARRRAQLWLHAARRENKRSARAVSACLETLRRLGWINRYN